jgi:Tfp pilus assembly protein PilF
MGLYDKSFAEYEAAANDPRWQAKALVMMGTIRRQSGDAESAADLFSRAIEAARTKDERCEANYELAMLQLTVGDIEGAKAALERVEPGFRDRDQKLASLS